jgi:8-oxo-dGTP pyrophosphatase MutT (NUDIX family)
LTSIPVLHLLLELSIKNVHAIIWKIDEQKEKRFLLTKEREGYFTVPGGCKDIEDADLFSTLHREMQEELGLTPSDYSVKKIDFQKEYENLYNNPQSIRFGKITVVSLFEIHDLKKEPLPSHEVKDVVWVNKKEVLQKLNSQHMKELFQVALKAIG